MELPAQVSSKVTKLRHGTERMRWGIRTVGVGAAVMGAARSARIHIQRPDRSEIRLKSGSVLEFDYPSQFPPLLMMFGDLIDPEFAFLRKVARPDWIVADIGAAIGQFTVFAASLPAAFIHAFEPSGSNVATLERNLERNGIKDKVKVHRLALSNADYEAVFKTARHTWVSGLNSSASEFGETAASEDVSVRTLTGELERLGVEHLSVLKLNVAGFEPEVLEGAEPFLAAGKADILILLLGLASLPWYARLAGHGYRFFYYHPTEHSLYEVTAFDEASVLDHRPWPARHIIAIHENALDGYTAAGIHLRQL